MKNYRYGLRAFFKDIYEMFPTFLKWQRLYQIFPIMHLGPDLQACYEFSAFAIILIMMKKYEKQYKGIYG